MLQALREFSVSTMELVYLAALLGADGLLGVDDPFSGQLRDEVAEGLARARNSLVARGLVAMSAAGTVAVARDLAAMVNACARPDASLLLTHTDGTQTHRVRCFHQSGGKTVELSVGPDADSISVMTELAGPDEVALRAWRMLGLRDQAVPPGGPVTLSADALRAGRRAAAESGAAAGESFLAGEGVPPEAARGLAQALAEPIANGSAVAMCKRDPEWDVTGFSFLHGIEGAWLLKPMRFGTTDSVEAVPVTGRQARAELDGLIGRVWARP